MKNVFLFSFLMFFSVFSFAQLGKGKVVDTYGKPISDVSIIVVNGKQSASSALDGTFIIKALEGEKLQFSKPNFESLTIKASTSMMVTLEPKKITQLDEVVVVGYGTKKAGSITGSVAQIKSAEI